MLCILKLLNSLLLNSLLKLNACLPPIFFLEFSSLCQDLLFPHSHDTILGSLSNDDGNGNENVTWKCIFISFVLLRDYFNSLNFFKNSELSRNQIGRSSVQVKKENENLTVVRSRSPQNLKWGHFTLLFCWGRQINVPKFKTHVQSDCFCSLNLFFCGVVVA